MRFSDKLRVMTGRVHYRVRLVESDGVVQFDGQQVGCFKTWRDAAIYAADLSERDGVTCLTEVVTRGGRLIHPLGVTRPGEDDGRSGVREPRRPYPGSSAGSVALDLPG